MTTTQDKEALKGLGLPKLFGHPLLKNFPGEVKDIDWKYMTQEEYQEIEDIFTKDVTLLDPIFVEEFYPQDMFEELVSILTKRSLDTIDYSNQMNKWEEGFDIPQKFIDYAVNKVKELVNNDDIELAYNMYAHHQITEEGRVPKLPLHIDWAPGAYMVDLHIGGNRDWGFVARYENFITKPNQAIICQPQFDYHYRPSWNNNDPEEYYQAFFLHMVNKNHWCWDKNKPDVSRPNELEEKFKFGEHFRNSEAFKNFQMQRRYMFDIYYLSTLYSSDAPDVPWDEVPSEEDTHIHQRKGIKPAHNKENTNG